MDVIAFSLTGIKKNDILRAGTKIDRVFKVISELNEMKIKKRNLKSKDSHCLYASQVKS